MIKKTIKPYQNHRHHCNHRQMIPHPYQNSTPRQHVLEEVGHANHLENIVLSTLARHLHSNRAMKVIREASSNGLPQNTYSLRNSNVECARLNFVNMVVARANQRLSCT